MSFSPRYKWNSDSTLHAYILDYLRKRDFGKAAQCFAQEAGVTHDSFSPPIDTPQGLLYEWWSVFWDVYLATSGQPPHRAAQLYSHVHAKRAIPGRALMQQPTHTPVLPNATPAPASQAPAYANGPAMRQMSLNGQAVGAQGNLNPNPAQAMRINAAQQNQYQRQQVAAAAAAQQQQQQQSPVLQPQPAPLSIRTGPPMTAAHSLPLRAAEHVIGPEFVAECIRACGFGDRPLNALNPHEQDTVHTYLRSQPQVQLAASGYPPQRMQQQPSAQGSSVYGTYPPQNVMYHQNSMPSPNPSAANAPYHLSSPASAPASQQQFFGSSPASQNAAAPTRRTAGRHSTSSTSGQQQQQHTSAPPTPEMSSAALNSTGASPRGRKRPRTELQQLSAAAIVPSHQVNGTDYVPPARPASAASLRGQPAASSPSPRMPPSYITSQLPPQTGIAARSQITEYGQSEIDERNMQLVGKVPPERKRSPMAPPPVPTASLSQAQTVTTPRNDDALSQHEIISGSPVLQPNGLIGTPAPSQGDISLSQSFYNSSGETNGSSDLLYDSVGGSHGVFGTADEEFDMTAFISGEDFHHG